SVAPFMFEASLDAADGFHAAPFIAAHGWYRQATGALRTALESVAIAAGYAVRGDEEGLARWRAGAVERNFGEAIQWLHHKPSVQVKEAGLPAPAVFGKSGVAGH